MRLTRTEAAQRIKEPLHARDIIRAKQKRIRHRLHTEADTDVQFLGEHHMKFLRWVDSLLKSPDNYERFRQLYRPPVFTNELVESIFSQYQKVFEAQNSYEKLDFTEPELELDAQDYRKKIGDFQFWETQGFETFKNDIDNLVVIDLPRLEGTDLNLQTGDYPEPYYYILDIDYLIDVENTKIKGVQGEDQLPFYFFKTEYVIFRGKGDTVYVFDDDFWRIFQYKDNEVTFEAEIPHGLGYCPARSFWTDPLNSKCNFQKRSPITNSISELDWLLFFSVARKYLELYAPFPIYAVYKGKCDYKEEGKEKARCVDGYLQYGNMPIPDDVTQRRRCPRCANKIKVGPGGLIELRVPKDKEDPDLMANPIKIIPAETESLEYMKKAVAEKWDEIFQNCVGRGQDANTDQAQNELQIRASFESRTAVLLRIKRNFEIIHSFALDTVMRLRYGSQYLGLTINYGDQFFVKEEKQQTEELAAAKTNGAPSYELATRRREIWKTVYRNNPEMVERLMIMLNLEPFPDSSIKEVIDMRKQMPEIVSLRDLAVKMNFNSFINRFEREQTNLLQYARALPYDRKIGLISDELTRYATEALQNARLDLPAPDPAPAPALPPAA